jgi:XTP/dITP diphosphohydrolase
VIDTPRGDGGFGNHPHIQLPQLGKTPAHQTKAEKNGVSHRAQALAQLVERLRAFENA